MCMFKDQHTVLVCDVAIGQVRERLTAAFGAAVQYTPIEGQGTLVQAVADVAGEQFQALTRAAIDQVQQTSALQGTTTYDESLPGAPVADTLLLREMLDDPPGR